MTDINLDKIVSLAKRRGFVYPGSEIYGGLANTWDYGPLGIELKNNVKKAWWKKFVTERLDVVGLDCAILMNPTTWEASGHIGNFADPLMDCKQCKSRYRGDELIENKLGEGSASGLSLDGIFDTIVENDIKCPNCGKLDYTKPRAFNLMFKTEQGVVEGEGATIYLRPETAQGIFLNFKNVQTTSRKKIPFGIGQIGKSFRNEITPGNFIFRTREFEQMELEFFTKPGTELEWYEYWKNYCMDWLLGLGLNKDNLKMRDHEEKELSHYSNATSDIEYKFPMGWGELWGIASRTDFDLTRHMEYSKKDLTYFDEQAKEKYTPYVIEPSLGADRVLLAFLSDAYKEEVIDEKDTRVVLKLHHFLAPIKTAVLPLSKKLSEKAEEVYMTLVKELGLKFDLDIQGSIGKRYRRQDEIGTPYCITVDFETLEDEAVTIRDRDTMEQERIKISELCQFLSNKFRY